MRPESCGWLHETHLSLILGQSQKARGGFEGLFNIKRTEQHLCSGLILAAKVACGQAAAQYLHRTGLSQGVPFSMSIMAYNDAQDHWTHAFALCSYFVKEFSSHWQPFISGAATDGQGGFAEVLHT